MLKFAVNQTLVNIKPTKDELSSWIEKVLKYKTLRDKFLFDEVTPELKNIGVRSIAIRKEGLEFVGSKRKQTSPSDVRDRCNRKGVKDFKMVKVG